MHYAWANAVHSLTLLQVKKKIVDRLKQKSDELTAFGVMATSPGEASMRFVECVTALSSRFGKLCGMAQLILRMALHEGGVGRGYT